MFLMNNVRHSGIVEGGERFQGTYVAAFEGDEIVGAAAHYWNGNLMPQAGDDVSCAPALARAALRVSGRELKGVVGEGANCAAVIQSLALTREQFRLYETEGLYELSIAAMRAPAIASFVRRATSADTESLVRFYRDYNIEALNEADPDQALADAKEHVANRLNNHSQFVLELNGEIVSASSFNATVDSFAQIGGVWTPHAYRSHGYARACVAGSLVIASRDGFTDAILFTGDDNVAAIKSYTALGFARIGEFFIGLTDEPLNFQSA